MTLHMKKIFYYILPMLLLVASCQDSADFLDSKTVALDENKAFSDSTLTMGFLTAIYQDACYSFRKPRWHDHGNSEQATDNAEYSNAAGTAVPIIIYSGTLNATSYTVNTAMNDFWNTPYTNLRRVNLFLSKLPITPLSSTLQKRVAAEARFLRVWYYHFLVFAYGGVPLIGDEVFSNIDQSLNIPRNTFEECINYMVNELDEISTILPEEHMEVDYGRVTSGACLALKSRILLYAASPLFNGGAETTDETMKALVSYPDFNVSRWQAAADAAKAVIETDNYSLHKDNVTAPGYGFYDLFMKRVNDEYIFVFNRPANRDIESHCLPSTRGGSQYTMPTQNLVDAFLMANGKPITDPASGYDPGNPYVGREPRFKYSIIYNTAPFYLSATKPNEPVYTYFGNSTSDAFKDNESTTGYYFRKMCDQNGGSPDRGYPLMRYAEILLNYAEAINETGHPEEAYDAIIELRERAGITDSGDGLYGLPANMTQDEMRKVIHNERRIELAFEDHRWNDMRRLKIGMEVSNGYNQRMRITYNSATSTYSYEVVNSIRKHNFRPAMYLMPIPYTELIKMPALKQNPGY